MGLIIPSIIIASRKQILGVERNEQVLAVCCSRNADVRIRDAMAEPLFLDANQGAVRSVAGQPMDFAETLVRYYPTWRRANTIISSS